MKKKVFREKNNQLEESKELVNKVIWSKKAEQIVENMNETQKYINEIKAKKTTKKKVGK